MVQKDNNIEEKANAILMYNMVNYGTFHPVVSYRHLTKSNGFQGFSVIGKYCHPHLTYKERLASSLYICKGPTICDALLLGVPNEMPINRAPQNRCICRNVGFSGLFKVIL